MEANRIQNMETNSVGNMERNTTVEMEVDTIVNMEANQTVEMESKTTLKIPHPLNIDCLYKIFEWFGLRECIKFAEAYDGTQCVADHMYKTKFTEFEFDFEDPSDRVFYHIGPYLQSLTLILNKFSYSEKHLKEIRETCKQLQSLTLIGFDRRTIKNNPFYGVAYNSEVLTLNRCLLGNDGDFFDNFTNLKSFNIIECGEINNMALKKCFENNAMLTSFVCEGPYHFYPHLLLMLPNLERLYLHYNTRLTGNSFSNFKNLRFLTLHCWDKNINDVLTELVKHNTLHQLEIIDVRIDDNTFKLINKLTNLERLVVTTHTREFTLPNTLPPKLKSLKLEGLGIFQQQITSLTKQLLHLEDVLLADCIIDNNGAVVRNFDSMANVITASIHSQVNRQLNVILTHFGDNFSKKMLTKGRLRIYNYLEDPSVFQISYPGIAANEYEN